MRGPVACGSAALLALALAMSAAAAKPGRVACPLKPGLPSGGDVQWAFTDSGRPADKAVKSSYVHGRGNWTSGRATGTACTTDSLMGTATARDLVLAVSGKSKLTAEVTQGGLLGVRIVLRVKVRASDDKSCPRGATGTATLFASYYSIHRDTVRFHFRSGCRGHNFDYSGPSVHVYIARHGAQVTYP